MSSRPETLCCIVNPASGQDEPVLAVLNRAWGDAVDWRVELTHTDGDAIRLAREAVAEGVAGVAVYGGDGTVAEVATGLAGSDVPLAILPGGTGNAVAQELGVPVDLAAAAALAVDPRARRVPVDAMRSGDRLFLLRFGIGAEARAIGGASRERKDSLGWFAYLEGAIQEYRGAEPARYRFHSEGSTLELDTVSCAVANVGRIGRGGLRFSQHIEPDDGWLDLLVVRRWDAGMLGAAGLRLLGFEAEPRQFDEDPGDAALLHYRVRELRVETDEPMPVHGDGDLLGETPFGVSIETGVLQVLVPAAPGASG